MTYAFILSYNIWILGDTIQSVTTPVLYDCHTESLQFFPHSLFPTGLMGRVPLRWFWSLSLSHSLCLSFYLWCTKKYLHLKSFSGGNETYSQTRASWCSC